MFVFVFQCSFTVAPQLLTYTQRYFPPLYLSLSPFCSLILKLPFITHLPLDSFIPFHISHNYNHTLLQSTGPHFSIPEIIWPDKHLSDGLFKVKGSHRMKLIHLSNPKGINFPIHV